MPDNKNNDDLYIEEEDLAADFLSEADLDDEISALTDAPAGAQPAEQPASEPQPAATETAAETPDGGSASSDTGDWVEDERVDLPGQLALDIYETKDDLVVVCRVAGVEEDNIDVSIAANNILTIRGNLASRIEENVENHFIQECYWGEFSRSVSLPVDVKKENIGATLEKGILKIIFTKVKQDAVKKISIKSS
ncbi:Hsp20 family protein [Candidatus Saccharibacteria bacterium]|nr:Hsp20 family protein [Candidatus Saccharibacteria bacterium]